MNYPKMDPERVHKLVEEGRMHLQFMVSLYQLQLDAGRFFVHEHTTPRSPGTNDALSRCSLTVMYTWSRPISVSLDSLQLDPMLNLCQLSNLPNL